MTNRQPETPRLSRLYRRITSRILGDDWWVRRRGGFRERERWGLVDRAYYAYGMLRAADQAKYFGHDSVLVLEIGVASGWGLLNMIELADLISAETGVECRITGFDSGEGLPAVKGYKDHAELWNPGDFAMEDRAALQARIDGRAAIVFGDIADTITPFRERIDPDTPLGFISIDVDIYSATVSALKLFDGSPELYLPGVSMYFDDVCFFYANSWAGELLAIREFNEAHELRKIDIDRSLPGRRAKVVEPWYKQMFVCHVLDHVRRNEPHDRSELTIGAHHQFMQKNFLY